MCRAGMINLFFAHAQIIAQVTLSVFWLAAQPKPWLHRAIFWLFGSLARAWGLASISQPYAPSPA
jgi:hypothetical protein